MKIAHKLLILALSALFGLPSWLYFKGIGNSGIDAKNNLKEQSQTGDSIEFLNARVGRAQMDLSEKLVQTTETLQEHWTAIPTSGGSEYYDNSELGTEELGSSISTMSTISTMSLAIPTTPRNMSMSMSSPSANPTTTDPPLAVKKFLAIQKRRDLVRLGLSGVNDTWLNGHIPERGGKPLRNILISTWRSGSSFVGEMIASHPGTLHLYEPFSYLKSQRVRGRQNATKAIQMAKSLSECQFDYPEWVQVNEDGLYMSGLIGWTKILDKICLYVEDACTDTQFISDLCKLFPIQFTKFVRLRLQDARELLEDERYDTRLLYLVRDPRGTMKSRNNGSNYWCDLNPDCFDEGHLCTDLVEDYAAAAELRGKYPHRFMVLRYEDISMNVPTAAETILNFFQLSYHPDVKLFVHRHSTVFESYEFGTYRKSGDVAFNWLQYYRERRTILDRIQNTCRDAMELWGYRVLSDSSFDRNETFDKRQLLLENPSWEAEDMRKE